MEEVDSTGKILSGPVEKLEDMGLLNIDNDNVSLSKKGEQLMLGDETLKNAWAKKDFDTFLKRTLELMND